jgi:hypothetical protein
MGEAVGIKWSDFEGDTVHSVAKGLWDELTRPTIRRCAGFREIGLLGLTLPSPIFPLEQKWLFRPGREQLHGIVGFFGTAILSVAA